MSALKNILITGGRVVDPDSGIDQLADVAIAGDRIVDGSAESFVPEKVIDASGCVVMAGGIDLHTHIGGGKVSLARMLMADHRSVDKFLPTASQTADLYLNMGYTTCFEPAVIPCNARSAHAEMAAVTGIDTGGYCLLGNDEVLLEMIGSNQPPELINDYVAWMVRATRSIAVKVVNPGGISAFKYGVRNFDLDTPHPKYGCTAAKVIEVLCRSVSEIGLVHPLHVHCSNLGVPGNIDTTLATIRAANGLPIHLTHAQFHCYAKGDQDHESAMVSGAAQLADAIRRHPNVTIDVGQIMFGQTVTISADTMHQHDHFRHAKPRKSVLVDVECEAGCGVVPFRYRKRQFVHSLQWAIGLELFLMIDDPSRVFLTTDHPNGAPFTSYPHLIRLLGDRSFRETALAEINSEAQSSCSLGGIDREYSLSEIATMTRSAPAKILGLSDRGHLSHGAIADVVIYPDGKNLDAMFATPDYVIKGGNVVRDPTGSTIPDNPIPSSTLAANVSFDPTSVQKLESRYESRSTFAMQRLWISDDEMRNVLGSEVVATDIKERQR
ncbi:formylmethanofuran dehydrogenase subunit A [Rubripirellula obstinata]|nr:formylmethanofuran dehydrogenase subunit A [Rubripirellula obstinata]